MGGVSGTRRGVGKHCQIVVKLRASGSIGTDNFEREFTLTLMESKDRTLEQIEEALDRIEDGNYGVCEECGAEIPKARLNAIPYAVLCVRCMPASS